MFILMFYESGHSIRGNLTLVLCCIIFKRYNVQQMDKCFATHFFVILDWRLCERVLHCIGYNSHSAMMNDYDIQKMIEKRHLGIIIILEFEIFH